MENKSLIESGNAVLGIEFGSTRIKAVLINEKYEPIANGSYTWENTLENGIWTYPLSQIEQGLQSCYAALKADVQKKFGIKLTKFRSGGISAMMHGYLAFDEHENLLVSFRTWRNTITGEASKKLSDLFNFPVPERWSISHFYQAILNKENHVSKIANIYTLSAYIHYKLTGEKVIGAGDASGMFPILCKDGKAVYNPEMTAKYEMIPEVKSFGFKIEKIFPKVLISGEKAGTLTKNGAKFLDPTGELTDGIPFCPPEGDAGTGMVATNSVAGGTGNISAGTSIFSMIVLEKPLKNVYPGIIDIVTTPDGKHVAMVHANNCTGEHNYWINLFREVSDTLGIGDGVGTGEYFDKLIMKSLDADKDCGGLLAYNYLSGESITNFNSGRPLFVRSENAKFTIANFMRVQMFTSLGALRAGMNILYDNEGVSVKCMTGAGGYFKTEAGLKYMAAAMKTNVSAMETAGEGGPWGIALLASFCSDSKGKNLTDFLEKDVFSSCKKTTSVPEKDLEESFNIFFERYMKGLEIERAAIENL